jgi:hypothetical protein
MTARRVLYRVLDELPARVITGRELSIMVNTLSGRDTYPSTLLGYAREYADISAAEFRCIDPGHSIYLFKPGFKIGNAILEGIE